MAATAPAIDPKGDYEPISAYVSPRGSFKPGQRLRGDHPEVVVRPEMFVPYGSAPRTYAEEQDFIQARRPAPPAEPVPVDPVEARFAALESRVSALERIQAMEIAQSRGRS